MSTHPPEPLKQTPTRPKHLVTRSITDISPPTLIKLHRPQYVPPKSPPKSESKMPDPAWRGKISLPPLITNIVSHHHHTHLHRKDHGAEKEAQGTQPLLQPHESGTKSEGVTPEHSRAGSRRNSLHGEMAGPEWRDRERRPVREEEVREERDRGSLRATELRNAIMGLNTLSNNTTRRLDNTYYAVLEKLSALQSTIVQMQELAGMTRALNEEFGNESGEIVGDVEGFLEGFEGFEEQKDRIEDLQRRVRMGRERIKGLGGRVDIVEEKVEGWKKAEGEWQEKTRKRLRIMWMMMAVVGVVLLALMGMKYTPARNQAIEALKGINASSLQEILPDLERIQNKTTFVGRSTLEALEKTLEKDDAEPSKEDPRLRLFDEL